MKRTRLLMLLATIALAASSCSPGPRAIHVHLQGETLIIDFPWSAWRLLGLQDRSWCISEIQVFDTERVIWGAQRTGAKSCAEVTMPIVIGRAPPGFIAEGTARFAPQVQYGVGIDATGSGRIDFILPRPGEQPLNIEGPQQIEAPCGIWWESRCHPPLQPPPRDCPALLVNWTRAGEGTRSSMRVMNRINFKAGRLRWNGQPVSRSTLRDYLRITSRMNPVPVTLFDPTDAPDCEAAAALRAEIDGGAGCQDVGICVQGTLAEWRKTPGPEGGLGPIE